MTRQLASAGINISRDGHYELNPVTGLYERTLLLEGSRTNRITRSEDFATSWSLFTGTTRTGGEVDPFGGSAAYLIADTDAAASGGIGLGITAASFSGDGVKACSLFVKQGTAPSIRVRLIDSTAAAVRHQVLVTFTAGVPSLATSAGAGTLFAPIEIGNGWYRIAFAANGILAANAHAFDIFIGAAAADTGSVYAAGAQVEDGDFPSSYIPTSGVAVTRAADSLSFPFTLPPQEMTVYAKFIERGGISTLNARIVHIGATTSLGPRALIYAPIVGVGYTAYHQNSNGGASVSVTAAAVPAVGDLVELRMVLSPTGSIVFGQAVNGAAEVVAGPTAAHAFASAWSDTKLWVGNLGGVLGAFAAFQSVKVARGTLTMDQMRALQVP